MTSSMPACHPEKKAATRASIVLAFASVYFFWGSTYTAIRIGAAEMPALLLSGMRFLIAGTILLAWCRWRGLRLWWPAGTMLRLGLIGLLLLGGGNVGLVYAEKTVPSGLASLVLAVTPLYVALIEMFLPGGNRTLLVALGVLLAGGFSWTVGSILSRRSKLPVNSLVAAAWEMLAAGVACDLLGTALGQWPQFHLDRAAIGSLAWLVTGGSLMGYTCFIYLLEHVPVGKVSSYAYVNPVVAVLLGILLLHERPAPSEFVGMAGIVAAVFLLTTAQVKGKPPAIEELEQMPAE